MIKKGALGKRSSNYNIHDPNGNRLQNTAVIAIFTLIKMGIDDRKIFRKFLASHNILPKTETTLSEYITQARKKIDHDFGNTAWLTEKIQVAFLDDYKKMWDHTDKYMDKNSELLDYVYQKARDKAKYIYNGKEDRFYEFLDMGTIHSTIKAGLEAMSFKRSLMEKGFFVYSFKRYIDTLLARMSGEISEEQFKNTIANDPMLKSIEIHSPVTNHKLGNENSKLEFVGQDPDKEFQLAEHLQGIKKKFGEDSVL